MGEGGAVFYILRGGAVILRYASETHAHFCAKIRASRAKRELTGEFTQPNIRLYSIPAILSPCLQMETQPRCIPRYFCNKVERICAIYLISTLADCTLPLWKNDIFTLSFSLRECRNTMYFHTSIALVVIEEEKSEKSKNKKSRTISHIWEIPLRLL